MVGTPAAGVVASAARPDRRLRLAHSLWRPTLGAAVVDALLLTGLSVFAPGFAFVPGVLLPLLIAIAGLLLAGLTIRRAPSVAWLAAIVAGYSAASLWFARATALAPGQVDIGTWLSVVGWASVAAIATTWIAARYATRPGRRLDPVAGPAAGVILGWLVLACLTTIAVVAAGQKTADPAFNWIDVATIPVSIYLPLLLMLVGLGVGADVRAARDRAVARGLAEGTGGRAETAWLLAGRTLRELVPGQTAAHDATVEEERTRLAGDLHAVVLPGLRRAINDAEAGGDPEVLARQLRAIDLELERLMAERWPVILEAFGLVAALEDLAERIEADGGPSVSLEIGVIAVDRPPRAVERTAWRVAQVALDNAVRHADGSAITITITAEPRRVRLVLLDDGRGMDAASGASVRKGGRGLADAARRAAEIGATLRIEPGPSGGTSVDFIWSSGRP